MHIYVAGDVYIYTYGILHRHIHICVYESVYPYCSCIDLLAQAASTRQLLRNLSLIGSPRFPLKGSFKGDIDIDKLSYHIMDIT